jgi:hypothetical protein
MKVRGTVSVLVLTAVVSIGGVGVAAASGSASGHHHARVAGHHHRWAAKVEAIVASGHLPQHFQCASAPTALARIATGESKLAARIARAQTREAAAAAKGDTQKVSKIEARIAKANTLASALVTVTTMIKDACPS